MSVTVQMMSSDRYSFTMFDGYRIINLKNEISDTLRIRDLDRIIIFNIDNEEVDDRDIIEENSFFYVLIADPPTIKISYENDKIILSFNDQIIDSNSYIESVHQGTFYEGLSIPDRPFNLKVDSSMKNNGYLHIIRIFRNQWLEDKEYEEDIFEESLFSDYYLSKIEDVNDLDFINFDTTKDNENNAFLEIDPHHHIYVYLDRYLPRRNSIYDNWVGPLRILNIDFL